MKIVVEPNVVLIGSFKFEILDDDEAMTELIRGFMNAFEQAYGWDHPAEIWIVGREEDSLVFYRAMQVTEGNLIDALFQLKPLPDSPQILGAAFYMEGWGLSTNDLEEGETMETWKGRIADNLKGKELRMFAFVYDDVWWGAGQVRGEEPYVTKSKLSEQLDSRFPDAVRAFMKEVLPSAP